jgi:putative membrane protein
MSEAALVLSLLAGAAAYAFGMSRRWATNRVTGWGEPVAFLAGLAVVAAALLSPLDGVAHRSLWVHMVQHVLLISVAAPLLALGRPLAVARNAWSSLLGHRRGWGPSLALPRPGVWTTVVVAAGAQVVVLLLWHVPVLYDAALAHDVVHGAEHISLLVTAVALWMALDAVGGEQGGFAVVALFLVSFPPLLLGAAMTFAGTIWYAAYGAGHRALVDQQLAGVVMWAYGGLAAVVGGVYLFARWLRDLEELHPGRPHVPPPSAPVDARPSC